MKLIDKAIDYVANRVLDRVEERRPVRNVTVNNVSRLLVGSGDPETDQKAQAAYNRVLAAQERLNKAQRRAASGE